MTTTSFEPEALAELVAAALDYERALPGLGLADRLFDEVERRRRQIEEAPLSFPHWRRPEIRRSVAQRPGFPPHILVFLVDDLEAPVDLRILAVMHPKQRPDYWRHRLPQGHPLRP